MNYLDESDYNEHGIYESSSTHGHEKEQEINKLKQEMIDCNGISDQQSDHNEPEKRLPETCSRKAMNHPTKNDSNHKIFRAISKEFKEALEFINHSDESERTYSKDRYDDFLDNSYLELDGCVQNTGEHEETEEDNRNNYKKNYRSNDSVSLNGNIEQNDSVAQVPDLLDCFDLNEPKENAINKYDDNNNYCYNEEDSDEEKQKFSNGVYDSKDHCTFDIINNDHSNEIFYKKQYLEEQNNRAEGSLNLTKYSWKCDSNLNTNNNMHEQQENNIVTDERNSILSCSCEKNEDLDEREFKEHVEQENIITDYKSNKLDLKIRNNIFDLQDLSEDTNNENGANGDSLNLLDDEKCVFTKNGTAYIHDTNISNNIINENKEQTNVSQEEMMQDCKNHNKNEKEIKNCSETFISKEEQGVHQNAREIKNECTEVEYKSEAERHVESNETILIEKKKSKELLEVIDTSEFPIQNKMENTNKNNSHFYDSSDENKLKEHINGSYGDNNNDDGPNDSYGNINDEDIKENNELFNKEYKELLQEKEELQSVIETMKKEKLQLLAKFKAYTLNNKKENEELKAKCKNQEEEIIRLCEQIKEKENAIEQKEEEIKQKNNDLIKKIEELKQSQERVREIECIIKNECDTTAQKEEMIKRMEKELKEKEKSVLMKIETMQEQFTVIEQKENEIRKKDSELKNKQKELEKKNEELAEYKKKYNNEMNEVRNILKRYEEEKNELMEKNDDLSEKNSKLGEQTNLYIEDIKRMGEENRHLKLVLSEKEEKLHNLEQNKKDLLHLDIQQENVLFCFLMGTEKLVCLKTNEEYYILSEPVFDNYYKNFQKPKTLQEICESTFKEQKEMLETTMEKLKEDKLEIEKEYEEYKNKIKNLITESNDHYKNIEEKNCMIEELNNSVLKYEEEIESYKNEILILKERGKQLEQEMFKERQMREQQNIGIADLKKKIRKEQLDLEKKYKEQCERDTQKKVNEIKEMYNNKEKLLQDQIDSLLYKVEKLTFSNEEKRQAIENLENIHEDKGEGKSVLDGREVEEEEEEEEEEIHDTFNIQTKLKSRDVVGGIDGISSNREKSETEIKDLSHGTSNTSQTLSKHTTSNMNIPIYPTEYKKIRKKLETYEYILNNEREEKKILIDQIETLKSQIKNYESISGNYESMMYQKNVLLNLLSQIPSRILIDDYITIVYNSFGFTEEEIEAIKKKRLTK